ncbi:hypothetical protein IPG36_06740 [bacterium]|nr:MAG: hypothetical protein IPG36_06740 [bacterium]
MVVEAEMLNDDYGKLFQKGAGYKLSLREAAAFTLEESDNTAINVIENPCMANYNPRKAVWQPLMPTLIQSIMRSL